MNGIRGKITVNGQPIDEYAKEQQEKDFMEHMNRQIFEIHHEIEETEEEFIYKVFDEHLRETGRGSFSKAELYRAVYLLEEERAGRLVYPWNQWIPVTERLPENSGFYFVTKENDHGKYVSIEFFYQDKTWSTEWNSTAWSTGWKVTAWMPLPKPYEEGAER